jgi:NAD(P)-dependent dehydrogenase (short-subunit alcohol dehydrogenase family)
MPEVVLAGGAGGLGSATAEMLAAEGMELVVSYRANAGRAAKLAGIARIVQADLTVQADRDRLLDAAPDIYGLVIFTGDPARVSDPSQMQDAMERSHAVNYLGPILLAREAAARMKAKGTHGAIVLFSTMQAVSLFPGSTAYAAPKAALLHAAKILAKENRGPADIRVNVICPGVNAAGMAVARSASGNYDRYFKDGIVPRFG